MKILFIQLPVQDPSWESGKANVPLAAGYLAAYAEKKGLLSRDEWRLLSREVSDRASDTAIVEAVAAYEPDLVCFTLYLWNLERSLHIARAIASSLPRCRLAAGGPEVVRGTPLFASSPFNSLIEGEGELPFLELLGDIRKGRPLARRYAANDALDLLDLPNPYLAGSLSFETDRPVHLETVRGCPAHCGYCYYGKITPRRAPSPAMRPIESSRPPARQASRSSISWTLPSKPPRISRIDS